MYAIVDIETTGSHAQQNGITEIAIVLYNGDQIEGRFETLVNPKVPIPKYIASLTGISNEMVATAPEFRDVAEKIYTLLNNRIFIAHNVNFDYSFIRYHLLQNGYDWHARKLCTLRLSRKAFPGLTKYGLGHLCRELDISIENRHRAGGDADATALLFEKILREGGEKLIRDFMKKEGREQILPAHLPKEQILTLPLLPGVYYFHNGKGKVVYVGKAKNIRNRVISHFTGLDISKKRQEFLRNIHAITFKECPTEFMASILESIEIKRLWPIYNTSQKRFEEQFGIYFFEDNAGYLRLGIDHKKKYLQPLVSFNLLADAHRMLWRMVRQFDLDATLCFLDTTGTNSRKETAQVYNEKVKAAIDWVNTRKESFLIRESEKNTASCILVEEGKFYGMGHLTVDPRNLTIENLKPLLTQYPENEVIRSMIRQYTERYPQKVHRIAV